MKVTARKRREAIENHILLPDTTGVTLAFTIDCNPRAET
jgi:hypothetical protein